MTRMKRPAFFRPALVSLAFVVSTPSAIHAQWARVLGGGASDAASFARATRDGGIVVAGFTASWGAGGEDVWVVKLDSAGTILWQRAYGGASDDRGYVVQEVSSGGFVVLGWTESFGAGGRDAWILRLDASGDVVWQRAYGGAGFDQGDDIRPTPDGGFIAACFSTSAGAGEEDFWLLKLDSAGNIQWQRLTGGPGADLIEHVETTSDGGYLATGFTRSFGFGRNDVWILKLSASGDVLWQRVIGAPGDDIPECLEKTADGGFVIAGATDSFGAGGRDALLLKFDASGALEWQRAYGGRAEDYIEAVRQASDGGYVIGGHTDSFGAGAHDVWVVRLDASGNILWQRTCGGVGEDFAYSLQPAASGGGFIAAGGTRSFGAGSDDVFLFRIASDGRIAPSCSIGAPSGASASSPNLATAPAGISPIVPGLSGRASSAASVATGASVQVLCQAPHFALQLSAGAGGTTEPLPGTSLRDFMDSVPLLALPSSGYLFDRWSGDVPDSGRLSNPVTVTMDGSRTVQANFRSRAFSPVNLEGKRFRTGAPPRAASADILTWEPNRANAIVARYRVYELRNGARTLLDELPAQILTFIRRGIKGNFERTYGVTTVDDGGNESDAATVTVAAAPRR